MSLTGAEKFAVLRLTDAVTKGASQAELVELRRDVHGALGVKDEAQASELTNGDARDKHGAGVEANEDNDAPEPAEA